MPIFETLVTLPCEPAVIFEFLRRPANVERTNAPELGLTYVDPPMLLEVGSRLQLKIQGQRVVHQIIELEPPRRFTEKQVQGPMKHWVHEHLFEPQLAGVAVVDRIEFASPGGLLGIALSEARIRKTLANSFEHQHRVLKRLFPDPRNVPPDPRNVPPDPG